MRKGAGCRQTSSGKRKTLCWLGTKGSRDDGFWGLGGGVLGVDMVLNVSESDLRQDKGE